jgi:hypothetical protein
MGASRIERNLQSHRGCLPDRIAHALHGARLFERSKLSSLPRTRATRDGGESAHEVLYHVPPWELRIAHLVAMLRCVAGRCQAGFAASA